MSEWTRLCKVDELSSQRLQKFMTRSATVLATLDDKNRVYVFDALCPHAQKPLHQAKWDSAKAEIFCLFHWAKYNLKNAGECISGLPSDPLKCYEVKIRVEGAESIVFFR